MAKFEIKPDDPIFLAVLKELGEFFGGDFPAEHVEDDGQLRQLAEEAAIRHMASRPNNESLDSVLGQVWANFWCNHRCETQDEDREWFSEHPNAQVRVRALRRDEKFSKGKNSEAYVAVVLRTPDPEDPDDEPHHRVYFCIPEALEPPG